MSEEKKSEKKYYFLKLEKDYFRTKEIKKLRKIAGGDTFTIIYLKMQLLSLNNKGVLMYEGVEENFPKELALELDEQEEDVKLTLAFLQANNMIEQINDYEYFLNRVPETITTETAAAKRMRISRQRKKEIEEISNNVTPLLHDVTPSYTDIDIEQEQDLDIDKKNKSSKQQKHKYGEYKNVLLSDEQLEKLKKEFPKDWKERIEKVSEYQASIGRTYKDYLATIRAWARKEQPKEPKKESRYKEL